MTDELTPEDREDIAALKAARAEDDGYRVDASTVLGLEYEPHPEAIASKLAYQLSGEDIGERIQVRTAESEERRSTIVATIGAVHQHREVVHVELDFEHIDIQPTTVAVHPSAQVDILTRPAKAKKKP